MKQKNFIFSIIAISMFLAQPVYAEESPVVSNVVEVTTEEKTDAFIKKYSAKMDELIELATNDDYSVMTNKMQEFPYMEMIGSLPYDGLCYPSENGEGLKLFADRLYCGSLVNGSAEGTGKMYTVMKGTKGYHIRYGVYTGQWERDTPNGLGEEWSNGEDSFGNSYEIHITGRYVNWYQDGDMVSEYRKNGGCMTYRYHVTDKISDTIDTKVTRSDPHTPVVAYADGNPKSFLTFYNTAQTVLHHNLDDGIKKNAYGYWNVGL